jgi:hypothetical protein
MKDEIQVTAELSFPYEKGWLDFGHTGGQSAGTMFLIGN